MSTNNYIAKLKARLDQAIIQRDHWKQVAAKRDYIVVTEVDPDSRSIFEHKIDADNVRCMWARLRDYDALQAELSAIKAQQAGQEPVAWRMWNGKTWRFCYSDLHGKRGWEPLYTTPQPAPAQDVAGSITLSPAGQEILAQCIAGHAYVLGVLVNGRPDLALIEAKKWVDGFSDASAALAAHDKQSGEAKP